MMETTMEEAVRPQTVAVESDLAWADDAKLVRACVQGAPEAFQALLARYRKPTLLLAFQMLGNGDDAEDIAQEAFVRVFQSIHGFRGQAAFSTWLYRIVTNLCLGRLRRRRFSVPLEEVAEPALPEESSRRVTAGLLTHQVLGRMSPDLRVVLLLREQGALSYQEIAGALSLPVGTVRSRLSKARAAFREIWNELLLSRETEP
jgi:RNA polymerase sigma-70 factor, ECF subfamily